MSADPVAVAELVAAAKQHLAEFPAFRTRPVGMPGSLARQDQDHSIAVEDRLRRAIKQVEA